MPNELPDPNAGANLNAISSLNTPSSLPSGTSATDVAAPNFVDPNIQPNSPPPAIPSPVTSPPLVAQSTTPYQANVQPPINPNSNFASALTPASLTEPGDSLQNQDDQQSADGQTNNEFGQPEVENLGFVAKASNYISTLSANFISAFNNNQRLFTLVGIGALILIIGLIYLFARADKPTSSSQTNSNQNSNSTSKSIAPLDSFNYGSDSALTTNSNSSTQSTIKSTNTNFNNSSDFGGISSSNTTLTSGYLLDPFTYINNEITTAVPQNNTEPLTDSSTPAVSVQISAASGSAATILVTSSNLTTCPAQTLSLPNTSTYICGATTYSFVISHFQTSTGMVTIKYATNVELNNIAAILDQIKSNVNSSTTQVDCGSIDKNSTLDSSVKNQFCFESRFQTCASAKMDTSVDALGSTVSVENQVFKTADQKTCILQTTYLSNPINPSLNNKAMTCAVDNAANNSSIAGLDAIENKSCRGDLWNLLYSDNK